MPACRRSTGSGSFTSCLSRTGRVLVEDTYYSDSPSLDRAALRREVRTTAQMGLRVRAVVREESGSCPCRSGPSIRLRSRRAWSAPATRAAGFIHRLLVSAGGPLRARARSGRPRRRSRSRGAGGGRNARSARLHASQLDALRAVRALGSLSSARDIADCRAIPSDVSTARDHSVRSPENLVRAPATRVSAWDGSSLAPTWFPPLHSPEGNG